MGSRGPQRIPTNILAQRGSWLAKDRLENEPKAPDGIPCQPDYLSDGAVAIWDRLIPQLSAMGVLSSIDQNTLGRYCQLMDRWIKASQRLQTIDETLSDRIHPLVNVIDKLSVQLLQIEREYGLTPASRSRVTATNQGKETSNNNDRFSKLKFTG